MARPGEMDQRITVNREVATEDELGGQTYVLTKLLDAWANVEPQTGGEQNRHDRVIGEAFYRFTIRNRRDVTLQENDHVTWEGIQYNIRFIERVGSRELYLSFIAERGVAQ